MSTVPNASASQTTILAVDDDPAVLRLLDQTLSAAGYRVLVANGGRSAIQVYEAAPGPVHLLLSDVMMPDLTGPVLGERLRASQPSLPVLFISAFHDAYLVQRFVPNKRFERLYKPLIAYGV